MPTAEVVAAGASGVGIAFTGPDVTRKAHLGSTGKQESGDSAYGEGGEKGRVEGDYLELITMGVLPCYHCGQYDAIIG